MKFKIVDSLVTNIVDSQCMDSCCNTIAVAMVVVVVVVEDNNRPVVALDCRKHLEDNNCSPDIVAVDTTNCSCCNLLSRMNTVDTRRERNH